MVQERERGALLREIYIEVGNSMYTLRRVMAERPRSPEPSSGVDSSRVWVPNQVMTRVPLSNVLNQNYFVKRLGRSMKCSPHLEVAIVAL